MSEPLVFQAVKQLAAAAREQLGPRVVSVRLFGSWARSDATADSDVDVCVVVAGLTRAEKIALFERSAELGWQTGWPLSVLVMAETDFAHLLELEARLALDITREGIAA